MKTYIVYWEKLGSTQVKAKSREEAHKKVCVILDKRKDPNSYIIGEVVEEVDEVKEAPLE